MKKHLYLIALAFALIYVYLFLEQQAGVNVLLFSVMVCGVLLYFRRLNLQLHIHRLITAGVMLSAVMTAFYGDGASLFVNIISLIAMAGVAAYPDIKIPLNVGLASASAFFSGPFYAFRHLLSPGESQSRKGKWLRKISLFLIPLLLLLIFILLYSASSPYFNRLTGNVLQQFTDLIIYLETWISPLAFWLFVQALFVFAVFVFGTYKKSMNIFSENGTDVLLRSRRSFSGRFTALKFEMQSGVILLLMLNLALLVMNVLDIYHVWLFFEWDGGYLKQFVHEGTWLLIFSILISIGIVVWLFRGNLNFYSRNKRLVQLSVIWLAQNALLVISVAIRNFWYIYYYNLAFKRIWVMAFLVLVLFGIFTVIIKLRQKKSMQYLLVRNSIAAYVILLVISLFNWDMVIARYNVKHSDRAFFHTNFMMWLDSSTLPVLHLSDEQLKVIDSISSNNYPDYRYHVSTADFRNEINSRRRKFMTGYPALEWQGWNVSDAVTYRRLKALDEKSSSNNLSDY